LLVGPIFARELLITPRRPRHYILRGAFAGLLFVLMWTAWQAIIGFQQTQGVADQSQFNSLLFQLLTFTQLTLVLFGACLYGASSIAYEKDRRTFVLLLVTRLRDAEIIVDKFLCAQLHVVSVLLAALPVITLTTILGGVDFSQVALAYATTLGAALVGGATGVLLATWRERTFQSVALTILAVTLSILVVEILLGIAPDAVIDGVAMSDWAACLSPFRALANVETDVRIAGALHPCVVYFLITAILSALYLGIATVKLRAWNPRGEPIQQPEELVEDMEHPELGRHPRHRTVTDNPVLWREIKTRAYGHRPVVVKAGYVVLFALIGWALFQSPPSPTDPRLALRLAQFVIPLSIISLLLHNTQAVTAITSERDLRSLDLLLVTDITPQEFIYGKLAGIAFNAKEMIAAPVLLLLACGLMGWAGPLALVYAIGSFLTFAAFSAVLGIHSALRYESSRVAIANSLGTMFLLFVGMLVCLFLILVSGRFEAQWSCFILFIVIGSIGMWVSLRANAPSNAIGLTAAVAPFATFYCIIAFLMGDRTAPFLVGVGAYGFAVVAMLIPLLSEFDVAMGRTTAGEG
jgi:ABC-type Na+ efflux pump permease subunit